MEGSISKNIEIDENSLNNCKHGTLLQDFCNSCLIDTKTNQEVWSKIKELLEKSNGNRKSEEPNCIINLNGENFKINNIESEDDRELDKILDLLGKYFKEDELISKESFRQKISGLSKTGEKRPVYRCFYVEDKEGKVIAARVSERLPIVSEDGKDNKKDVFYGIYIVVDEEYRKTGVARELYISALMDAAIKSEQENRKIEMLIAECTPASEKLMNTVGLKKIYFKNDNVLSEFNYYQPPVEFDMNTGKNITNEIAEHIMMCTAKQDGELNKNSFYETLASLYKQNEINYPRELFKNEEAFLNYMKYYESLYDKTRNAIDGNGLLISLNLDEQEEMKAKGMEIRNFEDANIR